ncbi:hypothetical protein GCM10027403_03140 [Arthrobacter tecti]
MPITYGPPSNGQVLEELQPVRAAVLRQVARRRTVKRASLTAAVTVALSLGGVSVAIGINPNELSNAEFLTKPQYVQQFAACMEARGWEPIPGSNDPQASPDVPAVHFLFRGEVSADIGADVEDCRATISKQVGEWIVPGM